MFTNNTYHDNTIPPGAEVLQPAWCQNCFRLTPAKELRKGVSRKKYCDRCAQRCLAQELEALFLFAEARMDVAKFAHSHMTTRNFSGNRRSEPVSDKEQRRGSSRASRMHDLLTPKQLAVYVGVKAGKTMRQIAEEGGWELTTLYPAQKAISIKFSRQEFRDAVDRAIKNGTVDQFLSLRHGRRPVRIRTEEPRREVQFEA